MRFKNPFVWTDLVAIAILFVGIGLMILSFSFIDEKPKDVVREEVPLQEPNADKPIDIKPLYYTEELPPLVENTKVEPVSLKADLPLLKEEQTDAPWVPPIEQTEPERYNKEVEVNQPKPRYVEVQTPQVQLPQRKVAQSKPVVRHYQMRPRKLFRRFRWR